MDGIWQVGSSPHMFAIPKSLEKEPAKLAKVYELLNYVSTGKGNQLVQFGLEGVHYKMDANNKVEKIASPEWDKIGHVWNYQFTGRMDELGYLGIRFPNQKDVIAFASNEPRILGLNGYVSFPDDFIAADTAKFAEEDLKAVGKM